MGGGQFFIPPFEKRTYYAVAMSVMQSHSVMQSYAVAKSFVMLGSAVRKLICLKGLRASPKNYYGNTTPSMA